jgi:hypothetical protein
LLEQGKIISVNSRLFPFTVSVSRQMGVRLIDPEDPDADNDGDLDTSVGNFAKNSVRSSAI